LLRVRHIQPWICGRSGARHAPAQERST
jgi:hypothetical protein